MVRFCSWKARPQTPTLPVDRHASCPEAHPTLRRLRARSKREARSAFLATNDGGYSAGPGRPRNRRFCVARGVASKSAVILEGVRPCRRHAVLLEGCLKDPGATRARVPHAPQLRMGFPAPATASRRFFAPKPNSPDRQNRRSRSRKTRTSRRAPNGVERIVSRRREARSPYWRVK